MTPLFGLLFLAAPILAYVDDVVDFTNYTVLTALPANSENVRILRILEEEQSINLKLDFWNRVSRNEAVNIGVPYENVDKVRQLLFSANVLNFVKVSNLKTLIDLEKKENGPQYSAFSRASTFAFDQYHTYEEIVNFIKNLESENPNLVKTQVLGYTMEQRNILSVRIGLNSNEKKPVILIDSGIHAREWVSPATALYIINQLVTNPDTYANLLETFDWHFIPIANPDGYAFTWSTNRLWRKNRAPSFNGCYGADPNRNFEIGFGGASTSTNPCSDLYPGSSAFSEFESKAIKSLTETHGKNIRAALTLHSFGQYWMSAWGYTRQHPSDYDAMLAAAQIATEALTNVHGTRYDYGSIFEVIYPAGGGSTDWQYQASGCPYCYAIELRDKGTFGFQLPRNYIIPTAEETWAGIQALADVI